MCSLDLTRDHGATVCRHVGRAGTVGQGMWDRMGVGGRREEKPAGCGQGSIFLGCHVRAQISQESRNSEFKPGLSGLSNGIFVKVRGVNILFKIPSRCLDIRYTNLHLYLAVGLANTGGRAVQQRMESSRGPFLFLRC